MWRNSVLGGVCVWACLFTASALALAQQEKKPETKEKATGGQAHDHAKGDGHDHKQMDPEMMAKMMPGEHHQHLQVMVGTWKCHGKFWMDPSMAEPLEMEAKSTIESVFDGRYITEIFLGEFGGVPFEGHKTIGYDNHKQEYVSTWFDSLSTGISKLSGKCDVSGKVFEYTGEQFDPHTGQMFKVRSSNTVVNENKHVYEMFQTPKGGKEFKAIEIVYERTGATPIKAKVNR